MRSNLLGLNPQAMRSLRWRVGTVGGSEKKTTKATAAKSPTRDRLSLVRGEGA